MLGQRRVWAARHRRHAVDTGHARAGRSRTGRTAAQVASGGYHTCAIRDDGALRCWGYNGYGQVGDTTTADRVLPTVVALPGGADAEQITAGEGHLANGCPAPVTPPSGGGGGGGGTTPTPTLKPELALSGRTLTFNAILKRAKKAKSCPKTAVATTGTGSSKRTKSLTSTTETVAGKVRCRITGTLTLKRKPKSGRDRAREAHEPQAHHPNPEREGAVAGDACPGAAADRARHDPHRRGRRPHRDGRWSRRALGCPRRASAGCGAPPRAAPREPPHRSEHRSLHLHAPQPPAAKRVHGRAGMAREPQQPDRRARLRSAREPLPHELGRTARP